jgi:hypothetical protein
MKVLYLMWIILKYDRIIIYDFPQSDGIKSFPQLQEYSNITNY